MIQELHAAAVEKGFYLLDSPVSGGNPMAIAGTLAIMTGGDKEAFDKVKPGPGVHGQSRLHRRPPPAAASPSW